MMEKDLANRSCRDFCSVLASAEPVPGGGGASALCGALGVALADMMIHLTLGKKKYAAVEKEFQELSKQCEALRQKLLDDIQRDADEFLPLSDAYRLPRETPEEQMHRTEVMEKVLCQACQIPLEIMECCARGLDVLDAASQKGNKMAVSDAAAGAILCLAAMESASLNVYINTASLADRALASALEEQADTLLLDNRDRAARIHAQVLAAIRRS